MSQISQKARFRRRYVLALVSMAELLRAKGMGALGEVYGEAVESVGAMLDAQVALCQGALSALEEAEAAQRQEVHEDGAVRAQRDASCEALIDQARYVRELLQREGGSSALSRYELSGYVPGMAQVSLVVLYGRRAYDALSASDETFTPRVGVPFSARELAGLLKAPLEALEAEVKVLAREERETLQARTARDDAEARYQRIVHGAALMLEGLCRQAGMPDAAERVRPSARRLGGRLDEDPLPDLDADDAEPVDA